MSDAWTGIAENITDATVTQIPMINSFPQQLQPELLSQLLFIIILPF